MKYCKTISSIVALIAVICVIMFFYKKSYSEDKQQLTNTLFTYIENNQIDDIHTFVKEHPNLLNETRNNETALEYAIKLQNYKIATELLTANVKTNSSTLLLAAYSLQDYENVIGEESDEQQERVTFFEQIIDAQIQNINVQDTFGNTALHIAASKGDVDIVNLLVSKGAIVTNKNHEEQTALTLAAIRGSLDCIKIIDAVDPSIIKEVDVSGNTILHVAMENFRYELYDYILEKNPESINQQNNRGNTPLLLAASYGDIDTVQYLLSHGADKKISNEEGLTPYDYAAQLQNSSMIEMLQ